MIIHFLKSSAALLALSLNAAYAAVPAAGPQVVLPPSGASAAVVEQSAQDASKLVGKRVIHKPLHGGQKSEAGAAEKSKLRRIAEEAAGGK